LPTLHNEENIEDETDRHREKRESVVEFRPKDYDDGTKEDKDIYDYFEKHKATGDVAPTDVNDTLKATLGAATPTPKQPNVPMSTAIYNEGDSDCDSEGNSEDQDDDIEPI